MPNVYCILQQIGKKTHVVSDKILGLYVEVIKATCLQRYGGYQIFTNDITVFILFVPKNSLENYDLKTQIKVNKVQCMAIKMSLTFC